MRRLLPILGALLLAVFVPYYLLTLDLAWPIARDGTGLAVGRDFLNFWLYGRAAWDADPARYYDLRTYWAAIEVVAGADYPGQQWSYPPTIMLLAAPFGLLPYLSALALWSALSVAVFVAAVRLWTREPAVIAACVLLPAGVFGLMSGQLAYLGAAAVLAVLRWREARPVAAGVVLGMMTLKPQLGLLFPVLLLATRSWRIIGVASAVALALAALTALFWGSEVWRQYLMVGVHSQSEVLTDPALIVAPFMPTAFVNLRLAGLSIGAAYLVQAGLAICAVTLVWAVFARRPAAADLRANGLFLAAGAVATPYLMAYDLLALGTIAALLAVGTGRPRWPALLVVLLPLLQMAAGTAGLPGPALVPILFAWALWRGVSPPAAAP